MSVRREISKAIVKSLSKITPTKNTGVVKYGEKKGIERLWDKYVFPFWFRFVRGPYERWQMAAMVKYLRDHGLMYDDMYSDKEPVIERAIELLPDDIATARYRRMMRGTHLNYLRFYLPPEEQNYDPLIPYLAPYIEEAKFQIQEEEELLGYHPYDRRLYTGGVTGFGDKEPGTHFLVSFPKMFG